MAAMKRMTGRLAMMVTIVLAAVPAVAQQASGPHDKYLTWSASPQVGVGVQSTPPHLSRAWAASVAAAIAATAADVYTTRAGLAPAVYETNPFGSRSYALRLGATGAAGAVQWLVMRRKDAEVQRRLSRRFVIANWMVAGFLGGIAIHNATLR